VQRSRNPAVTSPKTESGTSQGGTVAGLVRLLVRLLALLFPLALTAFFGSAVPAVSGGEALSWSWAWVSPFSSTG